MPELKGQQEFKDPSAPRGPNVLAAVQLCLHGSLPLAATPPHVSGFRATESEGDHSLHRVLPGSLKGECSWCT